MTLPVIVGLRERPPPPVSCVILKATGSAVPGAGFGSGCSSGIIVLAAFISRIFDQEFPQEEYIGPVELIVFVFFLEPTLLLPLLFVANEGITTS